MDRVVQLFCLVLDKFLLIYFMPSEKQIIIENILIKQFPNLILPSNPSLKRIARELLQARNLPEVLFWMQVTKGGFHKIDFDRQK
jgi:hypothetical protein